ncbi:MAG: phosphoribosylformylglycinamidine synthase subunit PurQ [Planctomycetaceae bacterium]|jgi:phosphoribosylformylglycinamidine synthase|nr:phosphoribosylformylglycinamidine synthase subunit PurQ [Planctomycetaceae bacterium]
MSPHVLILRAPGTNCNNETAYAFEQAGAKTEQIHINRWLEQPDLLDRFQILCFPGGFSYGDDIASGRILANQIRRHLYGTVAKFKEDGKLILGVCNGFQIMIRSGILLTDDAEGVPATLDWNESGVFRDQWTHLNADGGKCVFLRGIESMYLPVAHAEGRFLARNPETLTGLEQAGQLVLRYEPSENPNGSEGNVAGCCDATGRVFGLMPHPERHIIATQHPHWTRRENCNPAARGDGFAIFQNATKYFA